MFCTLVFFFFFCIVQEKGKLLNVKIARSNPKRLDIEDIISKEIEGKME